MKKILIPTDFSDDANNAFAVAVHLSRLTGARLKLLHVIEPPYSKSSLAALGPSGEAAVNQDTYLKQLKQHSEQLMRNLLDQEDYRQVEVEHGVCIAKVIDQVLRVIEEERVDLVVIGAKGAGSKEEMLIGSNTAKVVRLAPCAVLTVKNHAEAFHPQYILFPTNFEDDLSSVTEEIKAFQHLLGAKLHLLYVNLPGTFGSTRNLTERMREFADRYHLQNFTTNVFSADTEGEGTLQFAERIGADLLLMVTHGRTGISRFLSGSITEGVVNNTNLPVLTFSLQALQKRGKSLHT
ncbi:universal stress protein [soil metagenome]